MIDLNNQVYNQDVLKVLKKIPDNSLNMIYGDPDYNVGINYAGASYTKKWNEYVDWYIELGKECLRVLKPSGNIFMINYPKQNAHLRVRFLDDNAHHVYEYVWVYNTNVGHSAKHFTTAHRSILHITKSKNNDFYKEQVAVPYQNPEDKRIALRIEQGSNGRMPYSWMYYDMVKNVSKSKTFHSCQIPLNLVERLIKATTKTDDNIFILFGGSGSELILCRELGRNFVSCEIHRPYFEMIKERLANEDHSLNVEDKFKLLKKHDSRRLPNLKLNLNLNK